MNDFKPINFEDFFDEDLFNTDDFFKNFNFNNQGSNLFQEIFKKLAQSVNHRKNTSKSSEFKSPNTINLYYKTTNELNKKPEYTSYLNINGKTIPLESKLEFKNINDLLANKNLGYYLNKNNDTLNVKNIDKQTNQEVRILPFSEFKIRSNINFCEDKIQFMFDTRTLEYHLNTLNDRLKNNKINLKVVTKASKKMLEITFSFIKSNLILKEYLNLPENNAWLEILQSKKQIKRKSTIENGITKLTYFQQS